MKKITALIAALIMTCSVATGCGSSSDSSSSSKSESTSSAAATTSAKEEKDDTDANTEAGKIEDTMAYKFTQEVSSDINLDMIMSVEMMGDIPVVLKVSGDDFYVSMDMSVMSALGGSEASSSEPMVMELYKVGDTAYTCYASQKMYSKTPADDTTTIESAGLGSLGLTDSAKLVSVETTDDGLTCETFSVSLADSMELGEGVTLETDSDSDSMLTTFKYYFDENSELKKIETVSMGVTSSIIINSLSTENVEITLPDFTGWTEQSSGISLGEGEDMGMTDDTNS